MEDTTTTTVIPNPAPGQASLVSYSRGRDHDDRFWYLEEHLRDGFAAQALASYRTDVTALKLAREIERQADRNLLEMKVQAAEIAGAAALRERELEARAEKERVEHFYRLEKRANEIAAAQETRALRAELEDLKLSLKLTEMKQGPVVRG